jgi:hypothetical protein
VLFAAAAFTKKPRSQALINLQSAISEELQWDAWHRPRYRRKVLPMRQWYGRFKSVDDLLAIRGIAKTASKKCAKILPRGSRPRR